MELLWKREYNELGSIHIDILKQIRTDFSINSRIVAEEKEFFFKIIEIVDQLEGQPIVVKLSTKWKLEG